MYSSEPEKNHLSKPGAAKTSSVLKKFQTWNSVRICVLLKKVTINAKKEYMKDGIAANLFLTSIIVF